MSSSVLKTSVNTQSPDFQKNSRTMIELLSSLKTQEEKIREGGGAKAIESQHKKNRLTARERIAGLIDPGTHFFELGVFAAREMYEEWGGAPSAGTITGLGRVSGRLFMIIANDATVKAGAFFPDDREEGDSRAEHRDRESHPDHLSRRLRRRLSASAGRRLSRHRRLSDASFATTPS